MTLPVSPRPSAPAARRFRTSGLAALAVAGAVLAAPAVAVAAPTPPPEAPAPAAPAEAAPAETVADVRARLAEVTARVAEAEAREGEAVTRAEQLEREAQETRQRLEQLRTRLGDRARAAYTGGMAASGSLVALITSDRPTETVDRMAMLDAASGHDNAVLDETLAEESRLQGQIEDAAVAVEEAARAAEDARSAAAETTALLQRLVAEEEARARAAAEAAATAAAAAAATGSVGAPVSRAAAAVAATGATASGGQACPVGPAHSFIDSWGFARSGGRAHQGTDVMAPHGAPAYAVVDGTIKRAGSNGLGGIVLYLAGDNGHVYYYAHNASNLVGAGERVSAGQQIATVGNSGNAAGGAAHIHFEVHPGGGSAVNPYPFLRGLCG